MGPLVICVGLISLALLATSSGINPPLKPRARSLLVGVFAAGVSVALLFAVAFPQFSSNSPRLLGAVFAGGLLGAVPFLFYHGLGYILRPREAKQRPWWMITISLVGSLAIYLPYCLIVGLQAIIYLRCPNGSNAGGCLFG